MTIPLERFLEQDDCSVDFKLGGKTSRFMPFDATNSASVGGAVGVVNRKGLLSGWWWRCHPAGRFHTLPSLEGGVEDLSPSSRRRLLQKLCDWWGVSFTVRDYYVQTPEEYHPSSTQSSGEQP